MGLRSDPMPGGLTLRRLLLAFLLSIVVGLLANFSIVRADGFQTREFAGQALSSSVVLWPYDASPTYLSETAFPGAASISNGGGQTTEIGVQWANTSSAARTDAANTTVGDGFLIKAGSSGGDTAGMRFSQGVRQQVLD